MAQKEKSDGPDQESKPRKDRILWILAVVFIVLAIAAMWAIDYYNAPELIDPNTLPEAVGKGD